MALFLVSFSICIDRNFSIPPFRFDYMDGANQPRSSQANIKIQGHLDEFTKSTLYQNYDRIAKNLGVYPTITIYPRGHELKGGMGGFYYADDNAIDMVDHYYLISILAHEMRHAFQYIYYPDLFFQTSYRTAREYLNSDVERDANAYAKDYCEIFEYWEEWEYLQQAQQEVELIIKKKMPSEVLGLDDAYFRENPSIPQVVPRNYHHVTSTDMGVTKAEILKTSKWKRWIYTIFLDIGIVVLAFVFFCLIFGILKSTCDRCF